MTSLLSTRSPRWVTVLLVLGVVVTAVPGGAVALPAPATDGPSASQASHAATLAGANNSTVVHVETGESRTRTDTAGTIRRTFRVNRTPGVPGRVTVTYLVTVPDDIVELYPRISRLRANHTVTSTQNFTYDDEDDRWELRSALGETTSGRITYTVATNVTAGDGYNTVETSDWAFIDTPQLTSGFSYLGETAGVETTYETVGSGYGADGRVFMGEYTTSRAAGANQTVTVVRASAADPPLSAPETAGYLVNVSGRLAVGNRDPEVTAFLLPEPIRRGGRGGGSSFWVGASTVGFVETVAHEYVHTRQAWLEGGQSPERTGDDFEWFTEASADYYGGYLAWRAGRLTDDQFGAYLDEETEPYADAVLQDADSEPTELKNYYKGRRVLGALDVRVRQHTDGTATLGTVFRRINTLDNATVAYADFRAEVAAVTNESTAAEFDEYVQTTAAPAIPADIAAAYDPVSQSPSLAVAGLSVSPAGLTGNATTDQTVNFSVAGVSGDDESDTIAVEMSPNVTVVDGSVSVVVTAENGTQIPVAAVRLANVSGGVNNRVAFTVSPTRDLNATVSVSVSVRTPDVTRTRSEPVVATVQDSTGASSTANTTVTVEPADDAPADAVYEPGSTAAAFDSDDDGRIDIGELGSAAEAFSAGNLGVSELGNVAEAFAAS